MNPADILILVSQLLPAATTILKTIKSAGADSGSTPEVLDLVGKLTPTAGDLINRIEEIRNQTEPQYPQVWANVRDDWNQVVKEWNSLQG